MRLVCLLLLGVGMMGAAQGPQPMPGHGPYANQPGVKCWINQNHQMNGKTFVHCECKFMCDDEGAPAESSACQTYCDAHKSDKDPDKQCLCHHDDRCEPGAAR